MDEYSRVLSNPDNFIISDELLSRIESTPEDSHVKVNLVLDKKNRDCVLVSYARTRDGVKLTLDVSNLDFSDLLEADNIACDVCGEIFEFGNYFEYENTGDSSILILSDNSIRENSDARVL